MLRSFNAAMPFGFGGGRLESPEEGGPVTKAK